MGVLKSNIILSFLLIVSFTSSASVGITPKFVTSNIELTQISKSTIAIKPNVISINNEYFELEKSIDNKTFTTVCIIFAPSAEENFMPLQVKDKIKEGSKIMYYRIKKVENDYVSYSKVSSIKINQ